MASSPIGQQQRTDLGNLREWPKTVTFTRESNQTDAAPRSVRSAARGLGWFSLGLGLGQLIAPRRVARLIGLTGHGGDQTVMRLLGVREIVSGAGILAQAKPTPWLWARVGGDAMDLALLGLAAASPATHRGRALAAAAAVLGVTAADLICSSKLAAEPTAPYDEMAQRGLPVSAAVTVQAPASVLYGYWNGFQHLPRFMSSAATVEIVDGRQSRWRVPAPAGMTLDWEVEITEARPDEQIAWRTVPGTGKGISAEGTVRFREAPGNRGTQVIFTAQVTPPGGELGKTLGRPLVLALSGKLGNDLRRFKQLVELGEIVHSDDSIVPGPNPAQPVEAVPPPVAQGVASA